MVCTTRDQFRQIVDMLPSLSMEHGNFEGNIVLSIIEAMEKETKLYEIPPRGSSRQAGLRDRTYRCHETVFTPNLK